jgi:hypothetical protein
MKLQAYTDEMLQLTAQIAEELLQIKDEGGKADAELIGNIDRLAELASLSAALPNPEPAIEPTPETTSEPIAEPITEPVSESIQEPGTEFTEAPILDSAAVTEPDLEAESALESEPQCESEPQSEPVCDPNPERESELVSEAKSVSTSESVQSCEPESTQIPEQIRDDVCPRVSVATLRKAFSLNDIFFYRRTLFCGSQAMFNDALEAISASDGDVAKVLSEQFNIDANSDEAVAFVELIQPYLY